MYNKEKQLNRLRGCSHPQMYPSQLKAVYMSQQRLKDSTETGFIYMLQDTTKIL